MSDLERAAEVLAGADALFVGAGAGMGVDSGLPDFRGDKGFWKAYPPFQKLGLSFIDLANPRWFTDDPELAWGFYGHRLNLYRETVPHDGFAILRRWGSELEGGTFAFTSNVDGQFQLAGFTDEELLECHGSIHHMQCTARCGEIWDGRDAVVSVNEEFRAVPPLPSCPNCGALARPNILMFGDLGWDDVRAEAQRHHMTSWLRGASNPVIIECGAGTAVPTVRWQCERLATAFDVPLIRINPREAHGPDRAIGIPMGALDALQEIDKLL